MTRCDGNRPTSRAGEKNVEKTTWKLAQLAPEMRAVMTVYAGCIEGPRVSYGTIGDNRNVLLLGTAKQIAQYSIGDAVSIHGKDYQRNIGRKQEDTVGRLKDEMKGTGEFAGKGHSGYTITVNNELITADSVLNSYFKEETVREEGKELLGQDGKPMKYLGGVEMIVSAIIKPGSLELAL
jgi:hypothetical protein